MEGLGHRCGEAAAAKHCRGLAAPSNTLAGRLPAVPPNGETKTRGWHHMDMRSGASFDGVVGLRSRAGMRAEGH